MERIGLEDGARQPARRVADALETDDDDLAAEPMHLRQSRCISGRAAALASSPVAGVGAGAGAVFSVGGVVGRRACASGSRRR